MASNSFGDIFRVSTWGESHGPAIGCVIDGVPPRLPLSEADIQTYLDQRRPGQSRFVTQRQETDQVRILSGVFEGQTTGTPLSLVIENVDQRSKDYGEIKDLPITPIKPNMAFAIIVVAAGRRPAKPPCAWRPGRWRGAFWPAS